MLPLSAPCLIACCITATYSSAVHEVGARKRHQLHKEEHLFTARAPPSRSRDLSHRAPQATVEIKHPNASRRIQALIGPIVSLTPLFLTPVRRLRAGPLGPTPPTSRSGDAAPVLMG